MEFTGQNILQLLKHFHNDKACLAYLAKLKWSNGFVCVKCGNTKYSIRPRNLARDCHRCHHIESPTAGTMFHRLRFGLRKAFCILFEMSATTKNISASQIAKRYGISRNTAWAFMHRARTVMQSDKENPISGKAQVDDFALGVIASSKLCRSRDKKKKKIVGAVELTAKGKIKRAYFKKIEDYSSKSLRRIFEHHISKSAHVITDKWTGYIPLSKVYNIEQKRSGKENVLKQLHKIANQLKDWIRAIYYNVHEYHLEKYLNEFSFRINRSIFKENIFHTLILRMLKGKPLTYQMIKISP